MKHSTFFLPLTFLMVAVLSIPAFGQSQSDHYALTKSVMDESGRIGTSNHYDVYSAIAQPSPVGEQGSENYLLKAGFLPCFGISPLDSIQALVICQIAPDVRLWWETISGASFYNIYRDTEPFFTPGPGNLIGTAADTFYTDANAFTLPLSRYFYIVVASNP